MKHEIIREIIAHGKRPQRGLIATHVIPPQTPPVERLHRQ
jgi:hypothetical protein